jgi:lipoate-protein ligase A
MKYRMIAYREFSAAMNMAIDEAIMEGIRNGTSLPTIRFYGWDPSAVSIGYFQGYHQEVDEMACQANNVDAVRRLTGGGAVYHDREGEVTYSIIGPEKNFPKDIIASYKEICTVLVEALSGIGIPASFQPINDIIADGKKISGNAQTRRGGVLLQHGTVLFDVDVDKMFTLLKVGQEKVSDKLIQSVKKRVTSVGRLSDANKSQLIAELMKAFASYRDVVAGNYTDAEIERAEELAEEKYGAMQWLDMR